MQRSEDAIHKIIAKKRGQCSSNSAAQFQLPYAPPMGKNGMKCSLFVRIENNENLHPCSKWVFSQNKTNSTVPYMIIRRKRYSHLAFELMLPLSNLLIMS